jgi:hypothetical protein
MTARLVMSLVTAIAHNVARREMEAVGPKVVTQGRVCPDPAHP